MTVLVIKGHRPLGTISFPKKLHPFKRWGCLRLADRFGISLGIGYRESIPAVERGDVIVAIDVLRCSSSIVTALANGAKGVVPAMSLDGARRLARIHNAILAGERNGMKPNGFKLGNSPLEFKKETVEGQTIVLTTTSGTKAILLGKRAPHMVVGSLLNLTSTARVAHRFARASKSGVSLVTAGIGGNFSLEDFLCAGALADHLVREGGIPDDGCAASIHAYRQVRSDLHSAIGKGVHAKYLQSIGLTKDVAYSTRVNLFNIAAVYQTDRIVTVAP